EVLEQSLSRFISLEETREFTAALREVVERGVMRNVVLNPRSASGEVIPTSLNASALRDPDGRAIGVIGILRDMRELDKARADAERLRARGLGRQGDRRHRHFARHARVRAGSPRSGAVQERAAGKNPGSREIRGSRGRTRAEDDRPRETTRELAQGSREAQGG